MIKTIISITFFVLISCGHDNKNILAPLKQQNIIPRKLNGSNYPRVLVAEKNSYTFKSSDSETLKGTSKVNRYLRDKLVNASANDLKSRGIADSTRYLNIDFWSMSLNLDEATGSLTSDRVDLSVEFTLLTSMEPGTVTICGTSLYDENNNLLSFNNYEIIWSKRKGFQGELFEKNGTISFDSLDKKEIEDIVNRKGHITLKFDDFCIGDDNLSGLTAKSDEKLATLIISTEKGSKLYHLQPNGKLKDFINNKFPEATLTSYSLVSSLNNIGSDINDRDLLRSIYKEDLEKKYWHLSGAHNLNKEIISGDKYLLINNSVKEFLEVHTHESLLGSFSVIGGQAEKQITIPHNKIVTLKIETFNHVPIINSEKRAGTPNCKNTIHSFINGTDKSPIRFSSVPRNFLKLKTGTWNGNLLDLKNLYSIYTTENSTYIKIYGGNLLLGDSGILSFSVKKSPAIKYINKDVPVNCKDNGFLFIGFIDVCKDKNAARTIRSCLAIRENKEFIISVYTSDS